MAYSAGYWSGHCVEDVVLLVSTEAFEVVFVLFTAAVELLLHVLVKHLLRDVLEPQETVVIVDNSEPE